MAQATSVRVEFRGTLDFVSANPDGESLLASLGPSVAVGSPFAGFFVFDDSVTTPYSSGQFEFAAPPWSLAAPLGDLPGFADPRFTIYTIPFANPQTDAPHVYVTSDLEASWDGVALFQMLLKDLDPATLSSPQLADIPWEESLFHYHQVEWDLQENLGPPGLNQKYGNVTVRGTLSSLYAVPEPAVALLTALALAAFSFCRAPS